MIGCTAGSVKNQGNIGGLRVENPDIYRQWLRVAGYRLRVVVLPSCCRVVRLSGCRCRRCCWVFSACSLCSLRLNDLFMYLCKSVQFVVNVKGCWVVGFQTTPALKDVILSMCVWCSGHPSSEEKEGKFVQ